MENFYTDTSIHAATYHDKQIGYPFYFETSSFLYNKTYLEDWARAQIEAEQDVAAAEAAEEALAQNGPEEEADGSADAGGTASETGEEIPDAAVIDEAEVAARVEEALPKTIDDILAFADVYDAPEQVEAIFKWDVSDIFYNYYFTGNYMVVGGEAGDDARQIDIDNEKTRECLQVYQNLNQFFSIDTKEVTYDTVLQDFIDGKIVMTVATTGAVARLEEAKKEGIFSYEYGITVMPDLTADLKGRSLSVTNGIVINGYSEQAEIANDFAVFLTKNHADELYENTGKIASRYGVLYENRNVAQFMAEYESSISMPKLLGTSNFWVQLEICFSRIWEGEEVETLLSELETQIKRQLA